MAELFDITEFVNGIEEHLQPFRTEDEDGYPVIDGHGWRRYDDTPAPAVWRCAERDNINFEHQVYDRRGALEQWLMDNAGRASCLPLLRRMLYLIDVFPQWYERVGRPDTKQHPWREVMCRQLHSIVLQYFPALRPAEPPRKDTRRTQPGAHEGTPFGRYIDKLVAAGYAKTAGGSYEWTASMSLWAYAMAEYAQRSGLCDERKRPQWARLRAPFPAITDTQLRNGRESYTKYRNGDRGAPNGCQKIDALLPKICPSEKWENRREMIYK